MTTATEHRIICQDHVIEIIHTRQYCAQIGPDHLLITCVSSEGAALPFAEIGYRSHYLNEAEVIRVGDPYDK